MPADPLSVASLRKASCFVQMGTMVERMRLLDPGYANAYGPLCLEDKGPGEDQDKLEVSSVLRASLEALLTIVTSRPITIPEPNNPDDPDDPDDPDVDEKANLDPLSMGGELTRKQVHSLLELLGLQERCQAKVDDSTVLKRSGVTVQSQGVLVSAVEAGSHAAQVYIYIYI